MYHSMTGYGRYEGEDSFCSQSWEIRSVNGKQLSVRIKLPPFLAAREAQWEKLVRRHASRGRVDVSCFVQLTGPEAQSMQLNEPLAASMLDSIKGFAAQRELMFTPDLNRLFHVAALWQDLTAEPDESLLASLDKGLEQALVDWNATRNREGAAMVTDLTDRINRIASWVEDLKTATEDLASERFGILMERVRTLLDEVDVTLDRDRLLQELAVITDRMDVSEELTRLDTHISEFSRLLIEERAGGRKLDFLLQECFREINTCGNKAQDIQASRIVIDIKTELEKCREQVQNLE